VAGLLLAAVSLLVVPNNGRVPVVVKKALVVVDDDDGIENVLSFVSVVTGTDNDDSVIGVNLCGTVI